MRTQMVDGTGTTTYSYDDVYRLTSVTFPGSRTVSYDYDGAGRRTSMTYPGGTDEVTYGYDAANRLVSVTDWNADETTYAYDNANRMTTVTLPSAVDVVSTYTYDDADRVVGIDHVQGGTTTLAYVDYTLDAVGNRTQRVDDEGTHSYTYDDLYRLTQVTYPGPSTTSYVYDAFGNRASMTVGMDTTTYSYDDADRLTSLTPPGESAITYTWDDNGNLTDRGSDEFEWDFEDRMVSATVDSAETTFAYRGDGLRDSRTFNSNTVNFTWDIASGLPVVIDDEDARYVYGAGLVSQVTSSETYYYLSDGLGSTMVTVDSDGDVVNSYTYDVFGETRSESGAQASEFQFAGQQVDGSTGLQYLRARYLDMETGRFISRDPLSARPGRTGHGFAYASSNPVSATDPLGLCDIWEGSSCVEQIVANVPEIMLCYEGTCAGPGSFFQPNPEGGVFLCFFSQWPLDPPGSKYCQPFDPSAVSTERKPEPPCLICDLLATAGWVRLPGASGEYGTNRAAAQWKAQGWNDFLLRRVQTGGRSFTTGDGSEGWLLKLGNGRYTWAVRGPITNPATGEQTIGWRSFQRGIDQRSMDAARKAYRWEFD